MTALISDHTGPSLVFKGVHMAGKPPASRWDVSCKDGIISSLEEYKPVENENDPGVRFLCPSLCHPHIHIDKCFLLSHPKYAGLEIEKGDFNEAMKMTSLAKSRFEIEDLVERGRALIQDSINFGVTHIRAFVEVDLGVKKKCLEAGLQLKKEFENRCYIQICVFAHEPIVSYPDRGRAMMRLLDTAANTPGVEAFGSTPYTEKDGLIEKQRANMEFAIRTAKRYMLHLDFHIDYNLDSSRPSMVLEALALLDKMKWPSNWDLPTYRSIAFGHCTRLTMFTHEEWTSLQGKTHGLPIAFVGLPTSDLFMMGRPCEGDESKERARGTLQILHVIQKYGINSAIGISHVENAFTPQGSCDPLSLSSFGIGLYQGATMKDTDLLFQCVSNRAKLAMGIKLSVSYDLELDIGDPADFVIIGNKSVSQSFRARKSIQDVVHHAGHDRITVFNGSIVSD